MTSTLDDESPAQITKPSSYLPYLDGLRGLAIAMVLWYHTYGSWFQGGYIGVDVFFVLSGYLITSLLIKEHDRTGRVNLLHFYARRALRLLPAVIVMLGAYVAVVAVARPASLHESVKNAGLVLFYSANWARVMGRQLYGLGHCWSLSVEEQFYVVWPIVFLLIARLKHDLRANVVMGLAVGLAVWRVAVLLNGTESNRLYNGLDTHGDGLLVGCALACLMAGRERVEIATGHVGRSVLAGVMVVVLLVLAFIAKEESDTAMWWMYLIGFSAVAVASAVLVWDLCTRPGSVLRTITQWSPLVKLGRISYGVYLWHYPIYKATLAMRDAHHWKVKWPLYVLAASASVGVASLSYRLIEVPFLKLKKRFA